MTDRDALIKELREDVVWAEKTAAELPDEDIALASGLELVRRHSLAAAVALRAHPAGGVSEDVVERCAKLLDPWIWRELADHEDTPDNRATMQVTKEISRDRMRKALRAAGIGAGVVENDK